MEVCTYNKYTKLEDLPALRKGWVRLVHRCVYKDHVASIKANGLVFNRGAAQLTSSQRGGSYSGVCDMASVYNEDSFWQSMRQDDFACYDNARFADTKIIFDMPTDEFCLLETCGRKIKGKIDSKYIVGCVPNINGANEELKQTNKEIIQAELKSRHNPPSSAEVNNVEAMIDELLAKCKSDKKAQLRYMVYERMERCKEELNFELQNEQNTSQMTITTATLTSALGQRYNR